METTSRQLLTVSEVSQILNRSKRSLQRDVLNGVIAAEKLDGRTGLYLIDRATVDALLEARQDIAS